MLEARTRISSEMNSTLGTQTLLDLYASHRGKVSDKWTVYLNIYEELFRFYRDSRLRLLEIGIQNGGSLEIWSQYFENATALVGCDINAACTQLRYDDPRIHVVVGDANTDESERAIAAHSERFDLIIDDGSHRSSDIIRSFIRYFPKLEQGGIFVVEDLHCSYWQEFEGGLVDPWSSMSFFKRLADIINHEHWGTPYRRAEILRSFEKRYGAVLDEESLAQIHAVEFYNSVCVIRKRAPSANELGPRVVVGTDAITAAQLMAQHGMRAMVEAQTANPWSILPPLPEDELLELRSRQKVWLQTEAELRFELKQFQASASAKDLELSQIWQQLQQTQQQLQSAQARVEECEGQLVALEDEIRAIRASTSWRVTSPMRKLADFLRRR